MVALPWWRWIVTATVTKTGYALMVRALWQGKSSERDRFGLRWCQIFFERRLPGESGEPQRPSGVAIPGRRKATLYECITGEGKEMAPKTTPVCDHVWMETGLIRLTSVSDQFVTFKTKFRVPFRRRCARGVTAS